MWKPDRKVHVRRASWKFISVKLFLFKTIGKVCAPADSRVVAPAAAAPGYVSLRTFLNDLK